MLQYMSGKFYGESETRDTPVEYLIFGNCQFWPTITIGPFTIKSIENDKLKYKSLLVTYFHKRIAPSLPGVIIRSGDELIIKQLCALLSFELDCRIEMNLNNIYHDDNISNNIFPYFNILADVKEALEEFNILFDKIIRLSRKNYTNVINSILAFDQAVRLLLVDPNLAFSGFVYCIEALAQEKIDPSWDIYPGNDKIDKLIHDHPSANAIRSILLEHRQTLGAKNRFYDTVRNNLSDDVFSHSNPNRIIIKKSDLNYYLDQSYSFRSKFVHELKGFDSNLSTSQEKNKLPSDTFLAKHSKGYLYSHITPFGISKIAKNVIRGFVLNLPDGETEYIPYIDNEPDVVTVNVASNYWIHKEEIFSGRELKRTSALIEQMYHCAIGKIQGITDLNSLMRYFAKEICNCKKEDQAAVISTVKLYELIVRRNLFKEHPSFALYDKYFSECSIANIFLSILGAIDEQWDLKNIETSLNNYIKWRHRPHTITLPEPFEIALYVMIAKIFYNENNTGKYEHWINIAIGDSGFDGILQGKLKALNPNDFQLIFDYIRDEYVIGNKSNVSKISI